LSGGSGLVPETARHYRSFAARTPTDTPCVLEKKVTTAWAQNRAMSPLGDD